MKKLSILFSMALAVAFLTACGNEGDATTDAETAVETVTPQPGAADNAATPPTTPPAPTGPTTSLAFDETEFNFGKVDEGEVVSHTFAFKNTGAEPLIISNAKGSCGCTVPQWPREPIAPGEGATITVEFNSKGKKGPRNQKVTITANTTPPQTFIALVGEVIPKETEPATQVNQ